MWIRSSTIQHAAAINQFRDSVNPVIANQVMSGQTPLDAAMANRNKDKSKQRPSRAPAE